jgi:glycosyltransferase involved in cell wall biosynthesis
MRVLFVTELWPPHGGSFVFEQVKSVASHVSVTVVVLIPHPPNLSRYRSRPSRFANKSEAPELEHDIPVYYLRYRTIPELGKYLNSMQAFRALAQFLRRHNQQFDLIHAHFAYTTGFAAVRAGRQLCVPVVVTVHGSDINYYTRRNPRNLIAACYTIWGLRHATAVTAVSQYLKEKVSALGIANNRITVIPNGIDETVFFPRGDKATLRWQLQLPKNDILFIYVGNFNRVKGLEILLNAFIQVQAKLSTAKLIMIGSGELENDLMRQAKMSGLENKIFWAGQKPHEKIPLWMSAADFFVLSSLSEGYGLVLLEALACGTPVIASRVGGVVEVLLSAEFGIMVPAGDSEKFAEAMLEAVGKSWDKNKLVAYAQANTWSVRAQRLLQLYQTILTSSET